MPRKLAVTDFFAVIFTVHTSPFTESHPVQPVKIEASAGVGVKVTVVLMTKSLEQAVPQLMPTGLDVTSPLRRPSLVTARVKRWSMKMAVTDRAFAIVTVHVAPDTESHPVQPVNSESTPGAAVSVTCESLTKVPEQAVGQLMPSGGHGPSPHPTPRPLPAEGQPALPSKPGAVGFTQPHP